MSEFALVMQDMRAKPAKGYRLWAGKVVDDPIRTRQIEVGPEATTKMEICYHGKILKFRCGLCEYESERLMRMNSERQGLPGVESSGDPTDDQNATPPTEGW